MSEPERFRVHRGFLTAPAQDAIKSRRPRDQEDPDEIEIHNHFPTDPEPADYDDVALDDEEEPTSTVVARYPVNGYTVHTEGDHHVVWRGVPYRTDKFDADTETRDSQFTPPQTLADLNRYHSAYYGSRRARR